MHDNLSIEALAATVGGIALEYSAALSKTKLAKLIYFVDFNHFERHGVAMTGERYAIAPLGPLPMKYRDRLVQLVVMGALTTLSSSTRALYQAGPSAAEASAKLSDSERETIRSVVSKYRRCSGDEIVMHTHRDAPWLHMWRGLSGQRIDPKMVLDRGKSAPVPPGAKGAIAAIDAMDVAEDMRVAASNLARDLAQAGEVEACRLEDGSVTVGLELEDERDVVLTIYNPARTTWQVLFSTFDPDRTNRVEAGVVSGRAGIRNLVKWAKTKTTNWDGLRRGRPAIAS